MRAGGGLARLPLPLSAQAPRTAAGACHMCTCVVLYEYSYWVFCRVFCWGVRQFLCQHALVTQPKSIGR